MSPVVPSDVEETIVLESDSFCVAFKKLLRCCYLYYLWYRYAVNEDGEVTTEDAVAQWGTDICNQTVCADEEIE